MKLTYVHNYRLYIINVQAIIVNEYRKNKHPLSSSSAVVDRE